MSTLELPNYEILEKIGAGGMGEVYRARDKRIDRTVALKRLPPELAKDPDRLTRLEREARLLASLSHPNIAMLYGLEEADGSKILVLEYVSGETLADRLKRGPLSLIETLEVARQIARGLEKAHDNGIIHRDLKPGNVMITEGGAVKILDFGLAKAAATPSSIEETQSPTLSFGPTRLGTILGTPAYMSPEQVRGQSVDQRADIWAFGCLLYECLVGTRPFMGATPGDQMASILSVHPDFHVLPAKTPDRLRELIERCLQKNADQRWRHIGDLLLEIEEVLRDPSKGPRRGGRFRTPLWRRIALGLLFLFFFLFGRSSYEAPAPRPAPVREPVRFVVDVPAEHSRGLPWNPALAVSPDGKRLVYVGYDGPTSMLFERRLDNLEVEAIPGTEGASGPVFSPDGRWLLFAHPQGLSKLLLDGDNTSPLRVSSLDGRNGADWAEDGQIICEGGWGEGLVRIDPDGAYEKVTETNMADGEIHLWPSFVPDDNEVVFNIWSANRSVDEALIAVTDLSGGYEILDNVTGSSPRILKTSSSRVLLWMRNGTLLAAPINTSYRSVRVERTVPILDGILTNRASGAAQYTISPSHGGTLAYFPGTLRGERSRLAWIGPRGVLPPDGLPTEPQAFAGPSIAQTSDSLRFSVMVRSNINQMDVYDSDWEVPRRIVSDTGASQGILSPDGRRLIFDQEDSDNYRPFGLPADGTGEAGAVFKKAPPIEHAHVESWSRNGEMLAYSAHEIGQTSHDIYIGTPGTRKEHRALLTTPDNEQSPRISPDGRWIAYRREKPGASSEIWLQEINGPGQLRLSAEGENATYPQWSANGNEVYYLNGTAIRVVQVFRDGQLALGRPRDFFAPYYTRSEDWLWPYDVAADGRLLAVMIDSESRVENIRVTMNWSADMAERLNSN